MNSRLHKFLLKYGFEILVVLFCLSMILVDLIILEV